LEASPEALIDGISNGMLDGASDGLSDDMIEGESVCLSMVLLMLDGFSDR
jgi:hypothetical protein